MSPRHFSHTHLDELAIMLDFTRADLAANRRGRLTARQIERLRADQRRRRWPAAITWAGLGGLAGLLAALNLDVVTEWAIVGIGIVILGGLSVCEGLMLRPDPVTVRCATLNIGAEWQPRRRLRTITFELDGRTFSAPRTLGRLLGTGQRYRVHYAAGTGSAPCPVLSIEPVEPAIPVARDAQRAA